MSRTDRDISPTGSRHWSEPTNYSLDDICAVSPPGTDAPLSRTSAIPSQSHQARQERRAKRHLPHFTVYPAKVYNNASIEIQDVGDGRTATEITSQLAPMDGRSFVIARYDQYGHVCDTALYLKDPSEGHQQSRRSFVDPDDFGRMVQTSYDPSGQRELRVLVRPQPIDNPVCLESAEAWSCMVLAEADLSKRVDIPDHWIPSHSRASNLAIGVDGDDPIPSIESDRGEATPRNQAFRHNHT